MKTNFFQRIWGYWRNYSHLSLTTYYVNVRRVNCTFKNKTKSGRVPTRYWKYWISKLVFKTLKKYWILPKCALGIEKVWKFYMEKKSQVSEGNFAEDKALHHLFIVVQCVKLIFMIKNFEKW